MICSGCDGTAHHGKEEINSISEVDMQFNIGISCDNKGHWEYVWLCSDIARKGLTLIMNETTHDTFST